MARKKRGYEGACSWCGLYVCACDRAAILLTVLATSWPILLLLTVMVVACVEGPDGRRVLSPGARAVGGAMLEDVLACGLPLLAGAVSGEPDYLGASSCHLQRVGERLGQTLEAAPAPTVEHGKLVIEAAELEQAQAPRGQVKEAARECDEVARICWLGKAGEP